jgi:hypothetical protein
VVGKPLAWAIRGAALFAPRVPLTTREAPGALELRAGAQGWNAGGRQRPALPPDVTSVARRLLTCCVCFVPRDYILLERAERSVKGQTQTYHPAAGLLKVAYRFCVADVRKRPPDRPSASHCDDGEMIRRRAPRFAPTRDGLFGGCRVFPCANISTYWAMRRARVSAFFASWTR